MNVKRLGLARDQLEKHSQFLQLFQAEVSWSPPEGEGHANLVGYQIKLRSNISMEDFQGPQVF